MTIDSFEEFEILREISELGPCFPTRRAISDLMAVGYDRDASDIMNAAIFLH